MFFRGTPWSIKYSPNAPIGSAGSPTTYSLIKHTAFQVQEFEINGLMSHLCRIASILSVNVIYQPSGNRQEQVISAVKRPKIR